MFSHSMSRSDLPSIAAAVVPINKFSIDREQHFGPFDADTDSATGSYNVAVPGCPSSSAEAWSWVLPHQAARSH